ncbi:MAG: hypothetical protein ACYTF8_08450 [Planctomycetota bacterium]|jgi:hypothetical protein
MDVTRGTTTRKRRRKRQPIVAFVEGGKLVKNKTSGFGYFNLKDASGKPKRYYRGRKFDDPDALSRATRWLREYKAAVVADLQRQVDDLKTTLKTTVADLQTEVRRLKVSYAHARTAKHGQM